jgi:hypothetical protein
MGLLELLQQGQTQLSAGSYPGDAPINDPQSGFVQSNSPTSTYDDETIGQPNNGSALVNTLNNTALDNTVGASTTNTFPPQTDTPYPGLTTGIFGYYATQFTEPYNPTINGSNGYYGFNNIYDIVDIETNPQVLTLSQTSLDNTDPESISLTINPLSVDTSYPLFARGKWRANALQFSQLWNSGFGYASNFYSSPSLQQSTLGKTALDNTLPERENTTYPIPNVISYPNDYVTLGNLPPQVGMGPFGFGPGQYSSNYAADGGYYSQNNYNNIILTSNNLLVITTPQSGLSPNNNETATFIQSYPYNQTYLGSPGFPEFVTGQFNGAPNIAQSFYNSDNTYLNHTPIQDPNSTQTITLSSTGLDNTDSDAANTAFTPNALSAPNNYPYLVSGEWGGAPSQYESLYNANNTYLSLDNTFQVNTLGQTSLDNTNSMTVSNTITPNSANLPNTYPPLVSGEFNGAPSQYVSPYNVNNTYLDNISIQDPNSPQLPTLEETGLDNTNSNHLPTTITPDNTTYPNIYPNIPRVNLGVFNSAPDQYVTSYTPNSTYLDQYEEIKNIITNTQTNTLDETGLDVENPDALPTSLLFAPTNPDTITIYPAANVTGVTGSAPQPFNQMWKPVNEYYSFMKENYEAH